MQYRVRAYIKADHANPFRNYRFGEDVAFVGQFEIKAADWDDEHAAEGMFTVGNKMGCDIHGKEWPATVRSLSVGDVLRVIQPPNNRYPEGHDTWLACGGTGWDEIPRPADPHFITLAAAGWGE